MGACPCVYLCVVHIFMQEVGPATTTKVNTYSRGIFVKNIHA